MGILDPKPLTKAAADTSYAGKSVETSKVDTIGTPVVRNVKKDGLTKFRKALTATRKTNTETRITLLGDSITYGYGASSRELTNWATAFTEMLTALVGKTLNGIEYATNSAVTSGAGFKRSYWTAGTGWTTSVGYGINNAASAVAGTTGLLSFGPFTCDSFIIYYMRRSTTGTFDWNVDGGAATTIGGSGADALMTATVSAGALGSHTLNLGNVLGGSTIIIGIKPVDSTAKITISNAGVPSAVTGQFINSTNPWEPGNTIWDTPQPHLTVIGLGTNDYSQNVAVATMQTNLTTLVTKAQLYGSAVLWIEPKRTDVVGTYPWEDYVMAIKAVAAAKGCPYIDINEFQGGGVIVNDSGDKVHPNDEGHYQIARAVHAAVTAG